MIDKFGEFSAPDEMLISGKREKLIKTETSSSIGNWDRKSTAKL